MPVPPRLSIKLHDVLGPEPAEDLVTWMDDVGSHHAELREAMRADFAEMRQEMHAQFAQLEIKLVDRIHGAETRLGDRITSVETKLAAVESKLIRWSFIFWLGAVAAIATLAGVLR